MQKQNAKGQLDHDWIERLCHRFLLASSYQLKQDTVRTVWLRYGETGLSRMAEILPGQTQKSLYRIGDIRWFCANKHRNRRGRPVPSRAYRQVEAEGIHGILTDGAERALKNSITRGLIFTDGLLSHA